jgi:predicted glycosyltransferase
MPEAPKPSEDRCDVFVYVQHLLGIGHLQRTAVLVEALRRAGLSVWTVTGGMPVADVRLGGSRVVQLPPGRALDASFSLVDETGAPPSDAWKEKRKALILNAFHQARPRCLLIELFPFGRRQMRFELLPLLEAARAGPWRPKIVTSLRDILNRPQRPEKSAWMIDTFRRFFDLAIVHSDPGVLTLEESFPEALAIVGRLRYSGFVVRRPAEGRTMSAERSGDGEVLVSIGGGAVGLELVEAALAARPLSVLRSSDWRFLLGPNFGQDDLARLQRAAPPGVVIERSRPDFPTLLAESRLSISQAGYNTVMEVLNLGKPAVVVPFAAGGESEQTFRAQRLASLGLLSLVEERYLTSQTLAAAVDDAVARTSGRRDTSPSIDLDGADATARILIELMEGSGNDLVE